MKKVVLITGASSRLGKVIVAKLAEREFQVYATVKNLTESKDLIQQWKGNEFIKPINLDVTDEKNVKEAVDKIYKIEKRIDVLINNAGYTLVGPTLGFSSSDFQKILDVNTVGAFRLIKAVYPYMKTQRFGKIINITSLNGFLALPNFGLYSSSKFALEGLGQALYYELGKDAIRLINIAPGAIKFEENSVNLPHKPAREKLPFLKFLLPMITPENVAKNISKVIEDNNPPGKIILGMDAKVLHLLIKVLPYFLISKIISWVWNKK